MLSNVMTWVKQMICLMIFLTLVLQFLPARSYLRYVKFFAGLIFTVTLMQPLLALLGTEGWQEVVSQIYETETADPDLSAMEERQEALYGEYGSRLTEDLEE
ncbi:MAG: stage III sporulation protein AF [Clostridiales bacterium]|nr:stage III sporulation protein AF [Lachnospiraceae bacterium]MCD8323478.1 stage III sporulation protein AF [Clostridiales bacterium]